MTLSSRHRIRNSSPGGLRPSTLPLGHGGSPKYWLSHVDGEETFFVSFKPPRPGTKTRTPAWKAAVLTTTLGPRPFLAKDELDERFSAQNVKLEHRRLTKSGIMITNHWMGWREFKVWCIFTLSCDLQHAIRELRSAWIEIGLVQMSMMLRHYKITLRPTIPLFHNQYFHNIFTILAQLGTGSTLLQHLTHKVWSETINECVRSYNNTKNAECQEHTWLYM